MFLKITAESALSTRNLTLASAATGLLNKILSLYLFQPFWSSLVKNFSYSTFPSEINCNLNLSPDLIHASNLMVYQVLEVSGSIFASKKEFFLSEEETSIPLSAG